MSFTSRWKVSVGWGDCDKAGIVYYPRFFHWFDRAAWAHFDQAGVPMLDLMEELDTLGMPLVDARCRFRSPARLGDKLEIRSCIVEWRHRSFDMEHKIFHGDILIAEGVESHIWGTRDPDDPKGLRASAIPKQVLKHFEGLD